MIEISGKELFDPRFIREIRGKFSSAKKFLRRAVLGGLFLLSVASPLSTKDLQAQIGKLGNEFDYYSDDTYSELVGYRIYCNSGQTFSYGHTSAYGIISPAGC